MLKAALGYGGPVAIRFPKGEVVGVALDPAWREVPIGKAEPLKEGRRPPCRLRLLGLSGARGGPAARSGDVPAGDQPDWRSSTRCSPSRSTRR